MVKVLSTQTTNFRLAFSQPESAETRYDGVGFAVAGFGFWGGGGAG